MGPAPFIVVVDANVLYPLTLRDTVLRAAAAGFYQLRWSADILEEMERNLVLKGGIPAEKAARLRATMERAFPEAEVTGYRPLISAMSNDPKDRHVVAAAVKAGAQVIVTSNIKDFSPLPDGIEARLPGRRLTAGSFRVARWIEPHTTFEVFSHRRRTERRGEAADRGPPTSPRAGAEHVR
jgi:predicted nucleic acid-binding protein